MTLSLTSRSSATGALALLLALSAIGCVRAPIRLAPVEGGVATIFVPGYRGSFLSSPEGDRAWMTVGEALTRGGRSLALPFEGQRPESFEGPLAPDGVLTGFFFIPGLFEFDAYRSFLEFGRDTLPGFTAFDYDWRRDTRESGAQLCARIDALVDEGVSEINVVAHSMGGLVLSHCLLHRARRGDEVVRRVVFIGTPFGGAPAIFDDLLLGTEVVRDRALLSPPALFSFPAAFQLLPPTSDFLSALPGEASIDALQASTWIEQRWGVFAEEALRESPPYREQLHRLLQAHREHWAAIRSAEASFGSARALSFVGVSVDTVSGFPVSAGAALFEAPLLADGDGTVTRSSALPPRGLASTVVEVEAEHLELMRDEGVRRRLADFLRR